MKPTLTPYGKRNRILHKLGFESYSLYLQSALWMRIRERVFSLRGRKCCSCGGIATQIHHRKYTRNNLSGKNTKHLFPICGFCHRQVELEQDGTKKDFYKAQRTFRKKLRVPSLQRQIKSAYAQSHREIGLDAAMERWGI